MQAAAVVAEKASQYDLLIYIDSCIILSNISQIITKSIRPFPSEGRQEGAISQS
jgi:hypothetical protein